MQGWQHGLEERIRSNSTAVVGEFGFDKVARVPGTGVCTSMTHQRQLFRELWDVAARHQRPVRLLLARHERPASVRDASHVHHRQNSLVCTILMPASSAHAHARTRRLPCNRTAQQLVCGIRSAVLRGAMSSWTRSLHRSRGVVQVSLHCVKAYGQLLEELAHCAQAHSPPAIMLHSYGGSAEQVPDFVRLSSDGSHGSGASADVGRRIFFSFSSALAQKAPDKARARIAAVPDDRLLIETDMEDMCGMNDALLAIVALVAESKNWSREHTVQQTWQNFRAFYDGFLPRAVLRQH